MATLKSKKDKSITIKCGLCGKTIKEITRLDPPRAVTWNDLQMTPPNLRDEVYACCGHIWMFLDWKTTQGIGFDMGSIDARSRTSESN